MEVLHENNVVWQEKREPIQHITSFWPRSEINKGLRPTPSRTLGIGIQGSEWDTKPVSNSQRPFF